MAAVVPDKAHAMPTKITETHQAFSPKLISLLCSLKFAAAGNMTDMVMVMNEPISDMTRDKYGRKRAISTIPHAMAVLTATLHAHTLSANLRWTHQLESSLWCLAVSRIAVV